jgi:aldehyde dehydrogenase (NAD+)
MEFLTKLGIEQNNPGAYLGDGKWSATTDAGVIDCINPTTEEVKWSATTDAGVIDCINPTTEEVIARVHSASESDYEELMATARAVFAEWRRVPAPKRGDAVRLCTEALRRNKDALGSLVALGPVAHAVRFHHALGAARTPHVRAMAPAGRGRRDLCFQLPGRGMGLECIHRGDLRKRHRLEAVQDYPPIFLSFMAHDHDLAEKFVNDERVDLMSFTGSTWVGREVGVKVARRMGRTILELGGNNAIIVDQTADLKMAIPGIVFGAVGTAGQRCTSTRRVIVHESRMNEVREKLVNAYRQVRIGDPLDPDTLMGPLLHASTGPGISSNPPSSSPRTTGTSSRPRPSHPFST